MFLYLISQSTNNEYDTYDSAVVVAKNEYNAKRIHPSGNKEYDHTVGKWVSKNAIIPFFDDSWCDNLDDILVTYIGVASSGMNDGEVVCASYNAG